MDNAWAAEKMYDWANIGENNDAWKEGPFLSAGSNSPHQISRETPYCLGVSNLYSMLLSYLTSSNPVRNRAGGVYVGKANERMKATSIVSCASVCLQFSLLESFDFDTVEDHFRAHSNSANEIHLKRYCKRPTRSRMESLNFINTNKISQETINAYESISMYRNRLTHEPDFICLQPSIALEIFILCQGIAYNIAQSLDTNLPNTTVISDRKQSWALLLNEFNKVKTDW